MIPGYSTQNTGCPYCTNVSLSLWFSAGTSFLVVTFPSDTHTHTHNTLYSLRAHFEYLTEDTPLGVQPEPSLSSFTYRGTYL